MNIQQQTLADDHSVFMVSPDGTIYTDIHCQVCPKLVDDDTLGVCWNCGVQVVNGGEKKGLLSTLSPLITNGHIYQGISIQCNSSSIPGNMYHEWQRRNNPATGFASIDTSGRQGGMSYHLPSYGRSDIKCVVAPATAAAAAAARNGSGNSSSTFHQRVPVDPPGYLAQEMIFNGPKTEDVDKRRRIPSIISIISLQSSSQQQSDVSTLTKDIQLYQDDKNSMKTTAEDKTKLRRIKGIIKVNTNDWRQTTSNNGPDDQSSSNNRVDQTTFNTSSVSTKDDKSDILLTATNKKRFHNCSGRWMRTVRATDHKFHWIRIDEEIDIDLNNNTNDERRLFNFDQIAYVRHLEFRPGEDPRFRTGILRWVLPTEGEIDSNIQSIDRKQTFVTYSQLMEIQGKSFSEKLSWFQETCNQLYIEPKNGCMRLNLRPEFLLGDSIDALMSLSRIDLRKAWRIEFIGEGGGSDDDGRSVEEWLELVCLYCFDPAIGLWQDSTTNPMYGRTIHPASGLLGDEDHLEYYRSMGRIMGKAIFDGRLIHYHLAKHLYKHILGWPIQLKDLEAIDYQFYKSLRDVIEMYKANEDVANLGLDFTITTEILGEKNVVELVKNGKDKKVTNHNCPEYIEACWRYKLMDCVKPQLTELLLGFFDVIPEPLMVIFDFQELELLMCGVPTIDVTNWKDETVYCGEFYNAGADHPTVQWFWETLESWDAVMKARLLHFVTGTSCVPVGGFGEPQGYDGNIQKFTIHGEQSRFPIAHTSLNRLDLPLFDTKEELEEKLKLAVTMAVNRA